MSTSPSDFSSAAKENALKCHEVEQIKFSCLTSRPERLEVNHTPQRHAASWLLVLGAAPTTVGAWRHQERSEMNELDARCFVSGLRPLLYHRSSQTKTGCGETVAFICCHTMIGFTDITVRRQGVVPQRNPKNRADRVSLANSKGKSAKNATLSETEPSTLRSLH